MLSHKLVLSESKNFTSGRPILAPPTIPINHYFSARNQQNRTEVLDHYSMLMYSQQRPALNTLIFFKVNDPDHGSGLVKGRDGPRKDGRRAPILTDVNRRGSGASYQKSNYELFNCNNFNICYWSWNYRGCWHQTCPPVDPR